MTAVSLRTLTEEEYAGYRARSVQMYADELVRSKGISREEASKNSATTFPATVADVLAEHGASLSRVLADDEDLHLVEGVVEGAQHVLPGGEVVGLVTQKIAHPVDSVLDRGEHLLPGFVHGQRCLAIIVHGQKLTHPP